MANDILFEIGLEELPARFIDPAEKQLRENTEKWLEELRITFENIKTFSTPRRLAVLISGVANSQTTIREEVRGPSEKIAKDEDGNWSKAAIGFTKGQQKSVEDIYTKEIKGTSYIFVEKHVEGKPTIDLLPSYQTIIENINFAQNMRWGEESLRYARPIRWLVALYNDQTIPFEIAQVKTGNITFGHRFLGGKISLKDANEYEQALKENFVIVNKQEREEMIVKGMKQLEEQEQFNIIIDQKLLNEVRNLVEYPTVFFGRYEEEFLQLPSEVLITSMQEHQRYFPVKSSENELLPYFIGVRNGDANHLDTVVRGNEKVLYARLSDGQFFYAEDQKQSIQHNIEKLDRVVFQEKLGTMGDKVNRIIESTGQLADLFEVTEEVKQQAIRVAEISKFDLMTNMVNEFPELQGVMGAKYALHFGESQEVAQAVREHYYPVQANGELPKSLPGAIVSIADKLDTIVGFISVGLTPTGSQDPYSLRRHALGVLRILRAQKWNVPFESILEIAQNQYVELQDQSIVKDIQNFFKLRVSYLLRERGIEQDVIESVLDLLGAVLGKNIGVFSYMEAKAVLLSEKRNDATFKKVEEALVRVLNLAKQHKATAINPDLFETPSEEALYQTYLEVKETYEYANKSQDAQAALDQLMKLAEPIHAFFDFNMVMTDQEDVKNNRLALLHKIANLINNFADLTAIQWKQHS